MDQRLAGKAECRSLPTFGIETAHIVQPVANAVKTRFPGRRRREHNHLQCKLQPLALRSRLNTSFGCDIISPGNQPCYRRMRCNFSRCVQPRWRLDHRQQRQTNVGQIRCILDLWQYNQIRCAILKHCGVCGVVRTVHSIGPDRDNLAGHARCRISDRSRPRFGLHFGGYGILKIDNQHIGIQRRRLLQCPRVRCRHIQRRAHEIQFCSNVHPIFLGKPFHI